MYIYSVSCGTLVFLHSLCEPPDNAFLLCIRSRSSDLWQLLDKALFSPVLVPVVTENKQGQKTPHSAQSLLFLILISKTLFFLISLRKYCYKCVKLQRVCLSL